jgi:hypothetical protein
MHRRSDLMRRTLVLLIAILTLAGVVPARAQEKGTPAPSGGGYTNPTYGFLVGWYDPWQPTSSDTRTDLDTLSLTNGTSDAFLAATPAEGADAAACLTATDGVLAADPANNEISFAQQFDGRAAPGGDTASALGLFTYLHAGDDGDPIAMNALVHCRPVGDGGMLRIVLTTPADHWDDQVRSLLKILDWVVPVAPPGDQTWPQESVHITRGQTHGKYNSTPPTSGPHIGSEVAPWGVHTDPIENEVQVHNLEHGGVMFQYNCECPEAIAILEQLADPSTGYPVKVIAAPYPEMEVEIALTSWHYRWTMTADEVTREAVLSFIDAHVDHAYEHLAAESEQLDAWRAEHQATPAP